MVPFDTWLLFAVASVALAITPGPNLIYLVSRTLVQGRVAGLVSLAGTSTGLLFHILAAAFGISALLAAVPLAYDVIRWAGAMYLAWLAWQTWRAPEPEAGVPPAPVPRSRLWRDGATTGILNPKVALFQLALFPQFVDPVQGSVLAQSLVLGATQLAIVVICDGLCVFAASGVRGWFGSRPGWVRGSRRLLAFTFAALAARLVFDTRR
jgi:threonine/homoserine/homoserine lactone efflux protein